MGWGGRGVWQPCIIYIYIYIYVILYIYIYIISAALALSPRRLPAFIICPVQGFGLCHQYLPIESFRAYKAQGFKAPGMRLRAWSLGYKLFRFKVPGLGKEFSLGSGASIEMPSRDRDPASISPLPDASAVQASVKRGRAEL